MLMVLTRTNGANGSPGLTEAQLGPLRPGELGGFYLKYLCCRYSGLATCVNMIVYVSHTKLDCPVRLCTAFDFMFQGLTDGIRYWRRQ